MSGLVLLLAASAVDAQPRIARPASTVASVSAVILDTVILSTVRDSTVRAGATHCPRDACRIRQVQQPQGGPFILE